MKELIKADLFRVWKSKLTLVTLILVLAFPVLMTLMYLGINAMAALDSEPLFGDLVSANMLMSGVYSLTNNIGLVLPAFAGIFVCMDISHGTLRNKVIVGKSRVSIYLSHLIVSIIFNVAAITIYAAVTSGLALLFFRYNSSQGADAVKQILYWTINGTVSFVFVATISTFFGLVVRSIAPTIIFTIVLTMGLSMITSVVSLMDYEEYQYLVYLIPTFTSSSFSLNGMSLGSLFNPGFEAPIDIMFMEGLISYGFFGVLNTVLGILIFRKKDIK
ncbi:MAG: hypothetical protein IKY02_00180 [Lachnospiraceae bacterium]|nr:hypothetical protein [Lachnospiraceae bacterium]MBR5738388.1 hypothetical protein [Lachnospiraceae bacterium]